MEIKNTEVYGFKAAVRGMRNPKKSHHLSDSFLRSDNDVMLNINKNRFYKEYDKESNKEGFFFGENDIRLAQTLLKAGTEHAKFMRQIHVWADIDEPLYFWSEFDTYHYNTKNSESTMHKLLDKKNKIEKEDLVFCEEDEDIIDIILERLNNIRDEWLIATENKDAKTQNRCLLRAKRILPCSYEQLRTVDTNYAEIRNIVLQRRHHRLKEEWQQTFCKWATTLPYAKDLIFYGIEDDYERFVNM